VGDLVQVDNGMEIPADGILVLSSDVTSDESAMTGINLLPRGDFAYKEEYI
jgi:magnesium-transporting ATPase (P-type)